MSRKYNPPKKKKNRQVVLNRNTAPTSTVPAAIPPVTMEYSMARLGPTKISPKPDAGIDLVKYASLPRELKRIGLFTTAALIILIVSWLILR